MMAQYQVQHSCGHSATHQLYGKTTERQRRIEWLSGQSCPECYRAEQEQRRQAENAQAAESNQQAGLPALTGSDKQVAWAESIRAAKLAELAQLRSLVETNAAKNPALAEQMLAAIDSAATQTTAAWWIDRRDHSAQTIARELFSAHQPA